MKVRQALEEVAALRAVAACPHLKPNAVGDMLERADRIEIQGPDMGSHSEAVEAAAVRTYKERTGYDLRSPEDMSKIYAAIDEYGRREKQQQVDAEKRRRNAQQKSRAAGRGSSKLSPP